MRQYLLTATGDIVTIQDYVAAPAPAPVPPPVVVPPAATSTLLAMRGCNLTGGDTDFHDWSASTGPVAGTHYKFISFDEVDALIAAGMNTFRLLFTWEALQPVSMGPITGSPGNFGVYQWALYNLVAHIRTAGARVVLDIHGGNDAGFAAYRGYKVGTGNVSAWLADLWARLASRFGSDTGVMYGLTNEPHDIVASTWYNCAQGCINAIRAAGGLGTIWAPGVDWDGAGSWSDHNAAAWNLKDPLNNLGVQAHLYFDINAGGGDTSIASPTIGADRMKYITTWARQNGLKVLLGEVGLSAGTGLMAWANLQTFMLANQDVCAGFCFWAAGPSSWWGGYQFYCGPGSAQLAMIQSALK